MNTSIIDIILFIIPILLIIFLYFRKKESFLEVYEYDDTIRAYNNVEASKIEGKTARLLVTDKVCLSTLNKLGQENINCFTEKGLQFMKNLPINLGDKICIGEVCVDKNDFYSLTHYWMPNSITMYYGDPKDILPPWYICDGTNGTPDLRDRMLLGTGKSENIGNKGGEKEHTLSVEEMPKHAHTFPVYTSTDSNYTERENAPFNLGEYTPGGKDEGISDPCAVNLPFPFQLSRYVKSWNGFFLNMDNSAYVNPTQNDGPVEKNIDKSKYRVQGRAHNNIPPYYGLYYIIRINKEEFTNPEDVCSKHKTCYDCLTKGIELMSDKKTCIWSDEYRKCKVISTNDNKLPDSLPFRDAVGMGKRFLAEKDKRDIQSQETSSYNYTPQLSPRYYCSIGKSK